MTVTLEAANGARVGASSLTNIATTIEYEIAAENYIGAARTMARFVGVIPDLFADVAQAAYDADPKLTKKELAEAMGIPARDLAGLKRGAA